MDTVEKGRARIRVGVGQWVWPGVWHALMGGAKMGGHGWRGWVGVAWPGAWPRPLNRAWCRW